jgi:hypothetical protein
LKEFGGKTGENVLNKRKQSIAVGVVDIFGNDAGAVVEI